MMFQVLNAADPKAPVKGTYSYMFDARNPDTGDILTIPMQVVEIADFEALKGFLNSNQGRVVIESDTHWSLPFLIITVFELYRDLI